MPRILIFLFSLLLGHASGQTPDSLRPKPPRDFYPTTGLTAYYFWKEDSTGIIDTSGISRPFQQNRIILVKEHRKLRDDVPAEQLRQNINRLAQDQRWDPNNRYWFYRMTHRKERGVIKKLDMTESQKPSSVMYVLRNDQWHAETQRAVMYFSVSPTGERHFLYSSDSIVVPDYDIRVPANGLYEVYYHTDHRKLMATRIYFYGGRDVTEDLREKKAEKPVRTLLFVNGYRGPKRNNDPGDGLVTQKDRYHYWYKIDDRFIDTLQPATAFYLDGSFPIATSNYRTRLRFGMTWLRAKLTPRGRKTARVYRRLSKTPNTEGFALRKEAGRLAGQTYLLARCVNPYADTVRDTIDIVCHSMGYAYVLGMLDVIKDRFVLGKMYIMAPENCSVEGFDWLRFEEVWQYGSNLDQEAPDPLREQDGIAPQCAVNGLDSLPPDRGGRAFIPSDWPGKNFVDSHMIYSYGWMFDRIPKGAPGYIHK